MAKLSKENRFVVNLGKLKLSDNDRRAIGAAIQGAVLSHLAETIPIPNEKVRLLGDDGILGMYIPDEPGSQP